MASFNQARQEVCCKVIYCGPDGAGKRESLRGVHALSAPARRRSLTLVDGRGPELCFGHTRLDLGRLGGVEAGVQLFTVPAGYWGTHHPTYLDLLRGVDAVVYVADSRPSAASVNRRGWAALAGDLRRLGRDLRRVPAVFQWNKQDLHYSLSPAVMRELLDPGHEREGYPTAAARRAGLLRPLRQATFLALRSVDREYGFVAQGDSGRLRRYMGSRSDVSPALATR